MILHENKLVFLELIQASAEHHRIPEAYVEKDYWVTKALKRLSECEYCGQIVFKGGTSLSKAYRLIKRFSEDIDLALKSDGLNGSQIKKLMKAVEATVTADLTYRAQPNDKKGNFRRTLHEYEPISAASDLGQVSDKILVELNAFADPVPSSSMPVSSLIQDFLSAQGEKYLISQHQLQPFDVQVLSVERTLCEKIMGLVKYGYADDPIGMFKNKIRHFYDISLILRDARFKNFIRADEFMALITRVKKSDKETFADTDVWINKSFEDALVFKETDALWASISPEFQGSFREMLYDDDIPTDTEVLEALWLIRDALCKSGSKPAPQISRDIYNA